MQSTKQTVLITQVELNTYCNWECREIEFNEVPKRCSNFMDIIAKKQTIPVVTVGDESHQLLSIVSFRNDKLPGGVSRKFIYQMDLLKQLNYRVDTVYNDIF